MSMWPRVKFREILRLNLRPYTLGPEEDANLVGMRWYGAGPFHRELKPAMRIAKKSHFVIRAGDVIYNKLFAWKGAFGVVPHALDGMFVSDKFPTYTLDRSRVDEGYLRWYFRCSLLWEEAREMSTGSAAISKLTLNPPKFLELTIPLPPLQEQQRVLARIEALAAQIEEARDLRGHAAEEAGRILFAGCEAVLLKTEKRCRTKPLGELVVNERGISYGVVQTGQDVADGVPTLRAGDLQWFACRTGRVKRVALEIERTYQRTRLRGGELLLRIRGGVGALAVCPEEMIGGNVSREIAVIPLTEEVDSRFAMFLLAAPTNQDRMSGHVKGTSYVGINLKDVRALRLPLPSLTEQREIVADLQALQTQMDALMQLQSETAAELDALVPAILDRAFKGQLLSDASPAAVLALQPPADEIASRRAAVACYIVDQLHKSPTFGRTQLVKGLYFAEAHAGVSLHGEYERQAAGPFDKSVYQIEEAAKREQWFAIEQTKTRQGYKKVSYKPLTNIGCKVAEAIQILGGARAKLDESLRLFKQRTTQEVEILATLYAAWNDLALTGCDTSDDAIIHESREKWHRAKQRIQLDRWRKHLRWMRQHGFVPTGTGRRTVPARSTQ